MWEFGILLPPGHGRWCEEVKRWEATFIPLHSFPACSSGIALCCWSVAAPCSTKGQSWDWIHAGFTSWAAAASLNKHPCVHGLSLLQHPGRGWQLTTAALGPAQAPTLQKQAGKDPVPCSRSEGRHTQLLLQELRALDQAWRQKRAGNILIFFSFHLKIFSCLLSSFGQCQAFLVLCPPICSPGWQRGQGSGWGGDVY